MNESEKKRKNRDASWHPVIISSVVYPGIGQYMQKRTTAGCVYVVAFTLFAILLVLVFVNYFRVLIPILRDAVHGIPAPLEEIPPIANLIKPTAALLFIYAANVIDVLRGRQKAIRDEQGGDFA